MIRLRIAVTGVVQGVGFRPFVWNAAQRCQCTGFIRNSQNGVEIELQGEQASIAAILDMLRQAPPPLARVESILQNAIPINRQEESFEILESVVANSSQALVSPDIAICSGCLAELNDPRDRRFQYPFINCTDCGPRFTIQQATPYDRARTTMSDFAMCDQCLAEYNSPSNRRFHAQPNACSKCGPVIWFVDGSDAMSDSNSHASLATRPSNPAAVNNAAIVQSVRDAISRGQIVAIKGVGGFHLACDARQPEAIRRLRERKQRPFKPLAIMVADIDTAAALVHLSDSERQLLTSQQRPIVLLRKRADAPLPEELAPGNPDLGVLLPYSPLNHLLLKPGDAWVMTSGNLADEPIAYENLDALDRLGKIADAFLLHDRPIHVVCDDSVVRWSMTGPIPIRRSRGFAPLPVAAPVDTLMGGPTVLAVGGELKNAVCLMTGRHAFVGQHIGDMGNVQTWRAAARSCEHLQSLYQVQPEIIAADEHPGYLSTQHGRQLAASHRARFIQVQHHHAHAAALMAEHGVPPDQSIIACVMDGTGYGSDGAIWGGEILIANARAFERAAYIEYAPLPGGDQCILHPARTALAYLDRVGLPWSLDLPCVQHFTAAERKLLKTQLDKQLNTVPTSSAGRLFDVIASLIGLRHTIDYEGQAAMELEFLAKTIDEQGGSPESYPIEWTATWPSRLQLPALLQAVTSDVRAGIDQARIAYKFHQTVARAIAQQCQMIRGAHPGRSLRQVGLTGGVFQNALLLKLACEALRESGFEVLIHQMVPPNDGGLALGQAVVARSVYFSKVGGTG